MDSSSYPHHKLDQDGQIKKKNPVLALTIAVMIVMAASALCMGIVISTKNRINEIESRLLLLETTLLNEKSIFNEDSLLENNVSTDK